MTRHCRPRREERHPRHSPANASSWNPLIRRKPGGPERIATSLSFLVCQVGSAQASELANQRRRLRGRGAWPFTTTGATIVGCDISRKLVAQAIELSRTRGVHASTSFLVADTDHLPFRDEGSRHLRHAAGRTARTGRICRWRIWRARTGPTSRSTNIFLAVSEKTSQGSLRSRQLRECGYFLFLRPSAARSRSSREGSIRKQDQVVRGAPDCS